MDQKKKIEVNKLKNLEEKFRVWIELISDEKNMKEGIKDFSDIDKILKEKGWKIKPLTSPKDINFSVVKANEGLMIDSVPLPENPEKGMLIGNWMTPEKNLVFKFWPTPDKFGIFPIPDKSFKQVLLTRITANAPRVYWNIAGGIRIAHILLTDEIALLNKEEFKNYVGELAREYAINTVEELI